MADSTHFPSFLTLTLTLFALTLTPKHASSSFHPDIALCGDAEFAAAGSRVLLTRLSPSSSGLLLLPRSFRLLDPKLHSPTSFSTEFAFSVSRGNAGGIALLLVPGNSSSKLSGNCPLGITAENTFPVAALDASSTTASGESMRSWVDYHASSKRLEVRLAKLNESRPYTPVFAYAVDFPETWKDGEVLVGLASSNVNSKSPGIATIYAWSFRLRNFPDSVHSRPVDPRAQSEQGKPLGGHRKRVCPLAILGGLIFATVCGALMMFSVLFLWAVVKSHQAPIPGEQSRLHCAGFGYEKVSVVVEKDDDALKN